MATVFDHSKENFVDSLGFDPKDIAEMNNKLADISRVMLLEQPQQSELCQKIAETFSYNELLLLTTLYVVDKTAQIIEENPILVKILLLEKMLRGDD